MTQAHTPTKVPHVLIVDDDQDMLDSIRRALSRQSYLISSTTDPREACRRIAQEPIDLILSDVQMPECNGIELMRLARTTRPEAIRILLTGTATLEVAADAINQGEVHRFLNKPFDATVLRKIVANALARKSELDRAGQAARTSELREARAKKLEAQYAGIASFDRDRMGAYIVPSAPYDNDHSAEAGAHAFDELALTLSALPACGVTDRQWGRAIKRQLEAPTKPTTPDTDELTEHCQDGSLDDLGSRLLVRHGHNG